MKHLRDPLLHPSWNYTLRSDSTAANAVDQPSLASGAGSDRPPSSLAEADGGTFRLGTGFLMTLPPPAKPRRDRLSIRPESVPSVPTGHLSLVDHLRGELGGSSEFERSSAVTPFGEVRRPRGAAR